MTMRSEEHTSELQSLAYLVCRLLLEKKKKKERTCTSYHFIKEQIYIAGTSISCARFCSVVNVGTSSSSLPLSFCFLFFFFFNDTATTEIYTLSLHDALPISALAREIFAIEGREYAQLQV